MKLLLWFAFVVCAVAEAAAAAAQNGKPPAIVFPQEIVDLLHNLNLVCIEETGISPEAVDELRRAKLKDDPKTKCYLKCMMRQLQAMTEDGNLDVDLIEATMPEILKKHGGVETVRKCAHIKESDMCETAYQLMVCFRKENPELTALFE